ncbi:MAG TPA: peptidoglycan-binding protein [Gammaproteobacteria bacterium]|nr:peptidoglycan-binding protein [Gammaproteobacteria bacterium]
MYKTLATFTVSAALLLPGMPGQAAPIDKTNTLPDAKPGQCYAKVMVPAKYETQEKQIVVREPAEKIETIPAKYTWTEKKVTTSAAHTKLLPVAAKYEKVTEKIEVSPEQKIWVTSMKKSSLPASPALMAAAKSSGLMLNEAVPGMCFREYVRAAQFKTEVKDVLVKEAAEKVEIIPAKYETVEEKVLIKEASKKIIEVPATYETITEKILIEPEKTVWKTGTGPIERIDNTTGEIMCLVKIPARYKTMKKQVVKTPATTRVEEIPAVYKTVKVTRVVTPAQEKRTKVPAQYKQVSKRVKVADAAFSWHALHANDKPEGKPTGNQICLKEVPAKFKTVTKQVVKTPAHFNKEAVIAAFEVVKVRKLVEPAKEKRTKIPAEYKTVAKRSKVSDERLEWRQVLCETNMTKDIVTRVQKALETAGYNPGSVDGVIGGATMRAVDKYQTDKGLPRGGLTLRTLESLGITI